METIFVWIPNFSSSSLATGGGSCSAHQNQVDFLPRQFLTKPLTYSICCPRDECPLPQLPWVQGGGHILAEVPQQLGRQEEDGDVADHCYHTHLSCRSESSNN